MNNRRRLIGTVKSNKMDKTVKVVVSSTNRHPLYRKVVRSTSTFVAHDELGCNVGDKVRIVECAPISRTKRFVVEEIIKVEVRQESDLEAITAEAVEPVAEEAPIETIVEDVEVAQEPVEGGETK